MPVAAKKPKALTPAQKAARTRRRNQMAAKSKTTRRRSPARRGMGAAFSKASVKSGVKATVEGIVVGVVLSMISNMEVIKKQNPWVQIAIKAAVGIGAAGMMRNSNLAAAVGAMISRDVASKFGLGAGSYVSPMQRAEIENYTRRYLQDGKEFLGAYPSYSGVTQRSNSSMMPGMGNKFGY